MELDAGSCRLRPLLPSDRNGLAQLANDQRVWRNMTEVFPHPYTVDDADHFIHVAMEDGEPTRRFGIEVEETLVGMIAVNLHAGVRRHVGTVGYWLTPDVWNRGIATAALRVITAYAFDTLPIRRLQASVFGWNPASARVLEKCGYRLEARLRDAIEKEGRFTDELIYGLLPADPPPPGDA